MLRSPTSFLGIDPRGIVAREAVDEGDVEPAPAPVAISVNLGGVVDTAGSSTIVVTGENYLAGDAVSIGGTPCTSVVVNSSTQITCVTPALAAGVHNLLVSRDDADSGSSGDGLIRAWDLEVPGTPTLALLPGGYSVVGTQGVDAVGTWTDASGNGNHAVSVGGASAPVEVDGVPLFNATDSLHLAISQSFAASGIYPPALADPDSGTVGAICVPDGLPANAAYYYNPGLCAGSAASPGLYVVDVGPKFVAYDGVDYVSAFADSVPDTTPAFVAGAWDSTGLYCRSNGGDLEFVPYNSPQASISAANVGSITYVGRSYNDYFNGALRMLVMWREQLSNDDLSKLRFWAQRKGYLS